MAYVRRRNRRWWGGPPRLRLSRRGILLLLLGTLLALLWLVERALTPALMTIARREAEIRAVQAIGAAVEAEIAGRYQPEDVVRVRYDAGRPVFVQVNTPLIVDVQARVLRAVQERLNDLRGMPVRIPLGAALGNELLAGWGPEVPVRILPLGRVDVDVESRFDGAGINQVRHRVVLVIRTTVRVAIPLYGDTVPVEVPVPLVETVIPGDVPPWVAPWPGAAPGTGGGGAGGAGR
ncbi:sporulation protein YunB [Thermaerobacter litoralis]